MTIDELKQELAQKTGMPAALLNGDSAVEVMERCEAILNYRRQYDEQHGLEGKSTAAQFDEWIGRRYGETSPHDKAYEGFKEVAGHLSEEAGFYPTIKDSGEIDPGEATDNRPPIEQFNDWFNRIANIKGLERW